MITLLKIIKTLVLVMCLCFCSLQSYYEVSLYFKYQIFTASSVVKVELAPINLVFCDSLPIQNQVDRRYFLYHGIIIFSFPFYIESFSWGSIPKACMACSIHQFQYEKAPDTISWNLHPIQNELERGKFLSKCLVGCAVGLSSIVSVYSRSMEEDISIMIGQKSNTQNNWHNR